MKKLNPSFRIAAMALLALTPDSHIMAQVKLSLYDTAQLKAAISAQATDSNNSQTKRMKSVLPTISNNKVGVLLTIKDGCDTKVLETKGLEITGQIGNHIYGKASIDSVDVIAASDGIVAFSLAKKRVLKNDVAREACGVNDVQAGNEDLLKAYNGEGVIAGILDMGLDASHIAFKNSNGENRIKRIWDFSLVFPRTYTESNLDNFTTDTREESHGTHVLGTIAGSCYVTDNGNDYHGIAPATDIAISCGSSSDDDLLDGVGRIIDYATEVGKPVVINMSLGNNLGPHDGSDTFTAALNELAGKDNVTIFLASGNEGSNNVALVTELTEDKPSVKTLLSSNDYTSLYYNNVSYTNQGIGYIDVWSEDNSPLDVYLDIIDLTTPDTPIYSLKLGETPQYIGIGNAWYGYLSGRPTSVAEFSNNYDNGFIGGYTEINSANNRFNATIGIYLDAKAATYSTTAVSLRVEGNPGQKAFIYNDALGLDFTSKHVEGFSAPTADGSISSMACGHNTISVGSFTTRKSSASNSSVGSVSSFSSWGVLNDGRIMPDFVAPGSVIYSAMSTYLASSPYYQYLAAIYPKVDTTTDSNEKEYYWTSMEGTSMSTPFATGVGALLLSVNPELQTEDIRTILKETATAPDIYEPKWGAGKLNVLEAVKRAEQMSSIEKVADPKRQMTFIPDGYNRWQVYAPAEDRLEITVTAMTGNAVMNTSGTNDISIDLNDLPAGIYILTATGSKSRQSGKIAVK